MGPGSRPARPFHLSSILGPQPHGEVASPALLEEEETDAPTGQSPARLGGTCARRWAPVGEAEHSRLTLQRNPGRRGAASSSPRSLRQPPRFPAPYKTQISRRPRPHLHGDAACVRDAQPETRETAEPQGSRRLTSPWPPWSPSNASWP